VTLVNTLLPPAGAEPGSVWLLSGSGVWFTAGTRDGAFWLYRDGAGEHVVRSPEYMALTNFTLSDPHGAAAAVAVLEGAGATGMMLVVAKNEHAVAANFSGTVDGFRRATHPTSFLAAALAAVREWEDRDVTAVGMSKSAPSPTPR